ncbi:NPCBM/NEW2 domain-containing protein [Kibdelosporangium aridum]|uniref:NPCBM/NEW2 domain-containing protein n=1 Tax=Kibdelosporangium aridum TaxID=2030 RepID=UPI00068DD997
MWYDLTGYVPTSFGNGHYSVGEIRIGTKSFPNSIRGSYTSTASDPNNSRTWTVAGNCTQLSVWVGKDADSRETAGTGRFIVKAEDVEITSAEAVMTDPAKEISIGISGVVRLTLFDTRGGRDANNAWGSPRVYCTAPPGKKR